MIDDQGTNSLTPWPIPEEEFSLNPHHPTPTGDSWAGGAEKQIPVSQSVSCKDHSSRIE